MNQSDDDDVYNKNSRRLSSISITSHSHVNVDENVLSIRSPRPPLEEKNQDSLSSNNNNPTMFQVRHIDSSNRRQSKSKPPNTSLTKSPSSSSHRKSHESLNNDRSIRKLSRESTISPLKDEDYFHDIGNEHERIKKDCPSYRESFEDEEILDDFRTKNKIRNAGFGNMLSFTSVHALNRFSNIPIECD